MHSTIEWQNGLVGQLMPNFGTVTFLFPSQVNQLHVALVRDPLTPRPGYAPSICGPWLTRQGHQSVYLICCCVTPQLLLSLSLGLRPLESDTSEIVAKQGAENFGHFLKRGSSKWGCESDPTLFIKLNGSSAPKTREFRNETYVWFEYRWMRQAILTCWDFTARRWVWLKPFGRGMVAPSLGSHLILGTSRLWLWPYRAGASLGWEQQSEVKCI